MRVYWLRLIPGHIHPERCIAAVLATRQCGARTRFLVAVAGVSEAWVWEHELAPYNPETHARTARLDRANLAAPPSGARKTPQ